MWVSSAAGDGLRRELLPLVQQRWRHQQVRDLAAVMAQPGLLAGSDSQYCGRVVDDARCDEWYQMAHCRLEQLDLNPAPLVHWLNAHQTGRLGGYFEQLVGYWQREILGNEIIAQNLTIMADKRTLGEFDLLFREPVSQRVYHWELSVKFYLSYHNQFIGPDPRDALHKKLAKVFDSQLRLSECAEARAQLQPLIADDVVLPQAFIKGRLFYPAMGDWQKPEVSEGLSETHARGWWCYHSELDRWLAQRNGEHRWLVLDKLEWLSSAVRERQADMRTPTGLGRFINSYFMKAFKALMVAELEFCDGHWHEVSRGVVVDDRWPEG